MCLSVFEQSLSETKTTVGQDDVRKAAFTLIMVSSLLQSASWNRHKHCVHTVSAAKHRIGNGLNCVNQL